MFNIFKQEKELTNMQDILLDQFKRFNNVSYIEQMGKEEATQLHSLMTKFEDYAENKDMMKSIIATLHVREQEILERIS